MIKKVMFSSKKNFVVFLFITVFVLYIYAFKVSAAANNIIDVEIQPWYITALDSNGDVWSWGRNGDGEFGAGEIYGSIKPVNVKNISKVKQISQLKLEQQVIALKEDGTVWTWGNGNYTPVQVKNLTGIKEISSGDHFSLALKEDGTVWTWGSNNSGQLGNGTEESYTKVEPAQVKNLSSVKQISAGMYHCLALKEDGTVWAWGDNSSSQIGDNDRDSMVKVIPVQVKNLTDIEQISAGEIHSIALKKDGTIWTWGTGDNGQLGYAYDPNAEYVPRCVNGINDIIQVSSGRYHTLVLKRDGTVYGFGYAETGALGGIRGTMDKQGDLYIPVKLNLSDIKYIKGTYDDSIAIDKNNQVFVTGNNVNGLINADALAQYKFFKVDRVPKIKKILQFGNASMKNNKDSRVILGEDGTVWSYGDNLHGELGTGGSTADRNPSQVSIDNVKDIYGGYYGVLALKNDGTLWYWGEKNHMSAMGESTNENILSPKKIEGIDNVRELNVDLGAVFAIKNDGTLWAWGCGIGGLIGQEPNDSSTNDFVIARLTPIQIPVVDNVEKIKVKPYHYSSIIFIISKDGRVWSSDLNNGWQKPQEIKELKGTKDIVSCSAYNNEEAIIALKGDGTLMSFGNNQYGQLGDGTFEDKTQPVEVKGIKDVKAVYCAPYTVYAVKNDGTLWTWGSDIQNYEGSKFNLPIQVKELQDVKEIFIDKATDSGVYAIKNNGELWKWLKTSPKKVEGMPAVNSLTVMQIQGINEPYYVMVACDNGEYWLMIDGNPTKVPLENVTGFIKDSNIIKTKGSDYLASIDENDTYISSQAIIDNPVSFNIDIPSTDGNAINIDESSYVKFKELKDVKEDKDFTVGFTSEVSEETINSDNIFVVDENNLKVVVKLEINPANKKEVFIKHINNYEKGKSYKIFISTNVKSAENNNIHKGKLIIFNVY